MSKQSGEALAIYPTGSRLAKKVGYTISSVCFRGNSYLLEEREALDLMQFDRGVLYNHMSTLFGEGLRYSLEHAVHANTYVKLYKEFGTPKSILCTGKKFEERSGSNLAPFPGNIDVANLTAAQQEQVLDLLHIIGNTYLTYTPTQPFNFGNVNIRNAVSHTQDVVRLSEAAITTQNKMADMLELKLVTRHLT